MININFLTPPSSLTVGGMEYLDFQDTVFFNELAEVIESELTADNYIQPDAGEAIRRVIEKHTNLRAIDLVISQEGNLAVDVAFFAPNHVLNSEAAEDYFSPSQSKISEWWRNNGKKMIKGYCDFKTGKVEGSFKDIPASIFINYDVSSYVNVEQAKKLGMSLSEVLAVGLIHEIGHIFFSLAMMFESVRDNLVMGQAICFLTRNGDANPNVTLAYVKDSLSLLECSDADKKEMERISKSKNGTEISMYFTEMIGKRNVNRCMSLGVANMNSEVLADAYAIRMGAKRKAIGAIGLILSQGKINRRYQIKFVTAIIITVMSINKLILGFVYFGIPGLLIIAAVTWLNVLIFSYVGRALCYFTDLSPDAYNTNHRRLLDAFHQCIVGLKEDKTMDPKQRMVYLDQLTKDYKYIESNKPVFEGSVMQRLSGMIFHGRDFKYVELEHYSESVANSSLHLINEKLKLI